MGQISLTLAESDYNRLKGLAQRNELKPLTHAAASLATMVKCGRHGASMAYLVNVGLNAEPGMNTTQPIERVQKPPAAGTHGVSVSVTISDEDLDDLFKQAELNNLRPATYAAALVRTALNGQTNNPAAWEKVKQIANSKGDMPLDRESVEKEFGPRTVTYWDAYTQSFKERDCE